MGERIWIDKPIHKPSKIVARIRRGMESKRKYKEGRGECLKGPRNRGRHQKQLVIAQKTMSWLSGDSGKHITTRKTKVI